MSIAACASSRVPATTRPFAGEAVGLDDDGRAVLDDIGLGVRGALEARVAGGRMPWRTMNDLAKSFDDTSCAAARVARRS